MTFKEWDKGLYTDKVLCDKYQMTYSVRNRYHEKLELGKAAVWAHVSSAFHINTLWTGDADLRLYITTVQDGWRKSAFLKRTWFPRTINLITQYMEHFSEWSYWRMFIETRVFGEYFLKISVHINS